MTNYDKDGNVTAQYTFTNDSKENKYGTVTDKDGKTLDNSQITYGNKYTIFGTSDNSCNAETLHNNYFGTSYTGPNNPKDYNGNDSYQYLPRNLSEYASLKHGDSLTYTSQTNGVAQKAIDAHNTELSGYYDFSMDKNGVVSMTVIKGADLSKMTPEQKAYAGIMDKVVNGTDGMTKIEVVENSTNVLIGDAKLQTIDIGDINKLPNGSLSPISAESAHLHV